MTFHVLLTKEFRECLRSFKLLWIPLVFLSLGISDPLINYYMNDILAAVGNMPEGFQMIMPELKPADLLFASTGQFQSIGLIVLVAVFVGTISRERQNGTATLIYMRPVSATSLFISKYAMSVIVGIISSVCGYAGSLYYTSLLFGNISMVAFAGMLATYCVWLAFAMSIVVAMSALLRTSMAAAMAIVLLPLGLMIDSLLGSFWHVSPWKLSSYGASLLMEGANMSHYWQTLLLTIALTFICIVIGIIGTKHNRQLTKV